MNAVERDDHFLDAIARGGPVPLGHALAALLIAWRADVRRGPIPKWVVLPAPAGQDARSDTAGPPRNNPRPGMDQPQNPASVVRCPVLLDDDTTEPPPGNPGGCDPWRGPREWFQYEARKVLLADRHLWLTNCCNTSMCLTGTHLVTLRPEPLDYMSGICVYCGLSADTKDHLIPRGWSGDTSRSFVLTVPACRQCNSFIGDKWAPTITERRVVAQKRIKSKYRDALRVHRFSIADLEEMGPNLRSMVDAKYAIAEVVRSRLAWPPYEDYDFGACMRAGFPDPYEAGLLR